jgi:cob(I)alamin adenosyltransferase
MVKLTKIYTKTGDQGSTGLAGGQRLNKDSLRVVALGDVDELNCAIGLAAEAMRHSDGFKSLYAKMLRIQQQLFNLGAQLCVLTEDRQEYTPVIVNQNITLLETEIDEMNKSLEKLNSFILPGGGEISTRLHLARAVCRRAERALVALNQIEPLDDIEIPFINRLSDWLFVAARHAASLNHEAEVLWQP